LWTLSNYLKNQINAAKWNRWLYRYSILHRKILKNSHKITLSKRLINSGFYDSKLFDKNIWASEHLSKINLSDSFSSFFNIYYNNIFNKNSKTFLNHKINSSNNGSQVNSLNLLNFYENSYFWYLKRFYFFNTLPNNFIKSKLTKIELNGNNFSNKNDSFNKYSIFLNYLLNSSYINLNNLQHSSNSYMDLSQIFSNFTNSNFSYNVKDIYLLNNDNDLLNKDNLNILYWVTSNSNKKNNLVFFNYLNLSNNVNININNEFLSTTNVNGNSWLFYSLINLDKMYLNDVTYLSLFY
jgi:hypothetical protein